jgi:hypothetical protein
LAELLTREQVNIEQLFLSYTNLGKTTGWVERGNSICCLLFRMVRWRGTSNFWPSRPPIKD